MDQKTTQEPEYQPTLFERISLFLFVALPASLLLVVVVILVTYSTMSLIGIGLSTKSNHGETLYEYIQNTRYEDYEYTATFLMSGDKITETTNFLPNEVSIEGYKVHFTQICSLGNYIDIHNHPGSGGSFSVQDVYCYIQTNPTVALVVTDSMIYELRAPEGWPTSQEMDVFLAKETGILQSRNEPICYNQTQKKLELFLYPEACEKFVEEFDLIYAITPIEEWRLN